jgi:predicted amidohydrolase YtcJ
MLLLALGLPLVVTGPAHAPAEAADALWLNGAVYTAVERSPRAGALAVRGGRILAVGSSEEMRRLAGPSTAIHDLEGRCVTPGLIDCHAHMSGLGSLDLGRIDLQGARSYADVARMVREAAAKARPGEWILGGRWDQSLWEEKDFPTHGLISEASPANPVWLDRVDGHMGLANRKAMEAAGIDRSTADPPGGEVLRDARGEPTGLFVDNAMALVERRIPGGRRTAAELILAAQERCLRAGLTGIHDAGIGPAEIEAYEQLSADGRLEIRVYAMASGSLGPDWLRANRPRKGERFTLRAVKLMADGAMGSRGAWLLEPYSDRPRDSAGKPYSGLPVQEPGFIRAVARASLENGWQVATHAIGDRAIRETLDAYQEVLRSTPGADHRFRIEHAQNPHPSDIPRFARLGVIASMQPSHAVSDMRWAEARVGPERVKTAYAWRQFLRAGSRLAFGSDFPVEDENPLLGIHAAVTREDREGKPGGGWLPGEKLSRDEALRLFTIEAARASFEEGEKGSLEPGKLADFVVWSHDIVAGEPGDLLRARPRAVVIGGKVVREAPGK